MHMNKSIRRMGLILATATLLAGCDTRPASEGPFRVYVYSGGKLVAWHDSDRYPLLRKGGACSFTDKATGGYVSVHADYVIGPLPKK